MRGTGYFAARAHAYHERMHDAAIRKPLDKAPSLGSLRARRDEILGLATEHRASNVRVFGSVARGTAHVGSDVDLLVDFAPGCTLIDQIRLWRELEELLGVRVDLVSAGGLTERDDDIRHDALAL
jgi:predicted nucleotidyltransferase